MLGVFRMYNVGQDTRFCPGGDKETSYMYELGFDKSYYVSSEPWVETVENSNPFSMSTPLYIADHFTERCHLDCGHESVGFVALICSCAYLWCQQVKDEAGELFHLLGPLIGKFQDALAEKASQVA